MMLCSYFDDGYKPRALMLISSADVSAQDSTSLLLLDEKTTVDNLSNRDIVRYSDFLRGQNLVTSAIASRTRVEKFFSVGPSFLLNQMPSLLPGEWLVYADADLYFFRPLDEYLTQFEHANVILAPHRHFAWNRKRLSKYGEFNVGLVAFRNNSEGLAALNYWAKSCLEWCSDIPADGKYADQKYLEHFSGIASGVVIDSRKGVNLAPWNLGFSKLSFDKDERLMVDGELIYYFHAQGIKRTKTAWILGHLPYFSLASKSARKLIYKPYLAGLLKWEEENPTTKSSSSRSSKGFAKILGLFFEKTLQLLLGQIIFDFKLRKLPIDSNKRPN